MKLRITKRGIRLYTSPHRYLRVDRCIMLLLILISIILLPIKLVMHHNDIETKSDNQIKEFEFKIPNSKVIETSTTQEVVEQTPVAEEQTPVVEEPVQQEQQVIVEEPVQQEQVSYQSTYETRMTSYYPNDGPGTGSITGSGLGPNNFEVNENGWYTYQGKLVIATATTYLLKYGWTLGEGVHTYKYYQEITLIIDGISYPAIVLDSCGHAMKSGRIDLFVSGPSSVKDTTVQVIE